MRAGFVASWLVALMPWACLAEQIEPRAELEAPLSVLQRLPPCSVSFLFLFLLLPPIWLLVVIDLSG